MWVFFPQAFCTLFIDVLLVLLLLLLFEDIIWYAMQSLIIVRGLSAVTGVMTEGVLCASATVLRFPLYYHLVTRHVTASWSSMARHLCRIL